MNNRYYTGKLPNSDMSKIYKVIVGDADSQAISPDEKDIVVKLHEGDLDNHACLNSFTEVTHQEARDIVTSWQPQIPM